MNPPNLTNKQLSELDSLFELVSQRQKKDFGNISASNKADGSLLTSCDLWSDKTIVDGLASIAPGEGVLSEEGQKLIFFDSSLNIANRFFIFNFIINIIFQTIFTYFKKS